MTTITTSSSRLEQSKVNRLLGPALKSLYDIEVYLKKSRAVTLISAHHLPDDVYREAARVFSEQELADLNLAVMSINSWNRLSIAFRYEPEPE